MIDFNNLKQQKSIVLICAIYAAFVIVFRIVNFTQFYFNIDNPLLPRYLIDYIAFPLFFIIPVFLSIFIYTLWSYKTNNFNKKIIIGIVIFSVLYYLFQTQIYIYIQSFSPYHSSNLN